MQSEKLLVDLNSVIEQLENEWGYEGIREDLYKLPTVDAAPVVHGRWIKDGDVVVCSNCGEEHCWAEYRATYCEDCGAKMDGGNENGG